MPSDDHLSELVEHHRKEVGERLRRLRTEAGLSQLALAERGGLDHRTVSRCENGRRAVSVDILARLAYALGIQPWQLLHDADSPRTRG
ncbi:helix-turn-helix transcriptional regulator [Streptomyces sp. ND04-05B]|uniref:helix-turn-helix domain-containing protein n=1 Tax=Streptomyces sp. ND04-05B TaxID=3028693 RepID=UPI0029BDD0F7|nr:helix-turn-helix transcriptional regulator [Streptomyces sp. ND04-05B]MDX3064022.1 helix-turn-helix transcriptional regulator [Streptomyces sp. ND04-05B]